MTAPENYGNIVAVHNLDLVNDELIATSQHAAAEFDVHAYSRMKFGDQVATNMFATELADALVADDEGYISSPETPLFAVAYKAVAPACYYLSKLCLDKINRQRVDADLEPGRILHVYKNRVTATNYAQASAADRQQELNSIGFSIESRDITDKPVTVLDDVRITGGAESVMLDLFKNEDIRSLTLGYVAMLNPEAAKIKPDIEHNLNTATVKSLNEIADIIEAGDFELNIRTLKYILGSEPHHLMYFLNQVDDIDNLLHQLYNGAINTGPEFIAQYQTGFDILKSRVDIREGNA